MKSDSTSKLQSFFATVDNFNKKLELEKRTKFMELLATDFKENERAPRAAKDVEISPRPNRDLDNL